MTQRKAVVKTLDRTSGVGTESTRDAAAFDAPPVDIIERPEGFILRADLPGVAQDALEVEVDADKLTITGTARGAVSPRVLHRTFALDDAIDRARISATLKDGVLTLLLPKRDASKSKPRRIEVTASTASRSS